MVSPADSTRLIYSLTAEDVEHYTRYHMLHTRAGQVGLLQRCVVSYLVLLGLIAVLSWFGGREPLTPWEPIFFLISAIWTLLSLRVIPRASAMKPNQASGLFGSHTVEISPQGVSDAGETYYCSYKWAGGTRIGATSKLILLYRGPMAVIVPRRAFSSPAAAESALEAIKRWQAEANPEVR